MASPAKLWNNSPTQALLPSQLVKMAVISDSAPLPFVSRQIRVATAGDLSYVSDYDGATYVITLLAGETVFLQARQITATNTTATGILVHY